MALLNQLRSQVRSVSNAVTKIGENIGEKRQNNNNCYVHVHVNVHMHVFKFKLKVKSEYFVILVLLN